MIVVSFVSTSALLASILRISAALWPSIICFSLSRSTALALRALSLALRVAAYFSYSACCWECDSCAIWSSCLTPASSFATVCCLFSRSSCSSLSVLISCCIVLWICAISFLALVISDMLFASFSLMSCSRRPSSFSRVDKTSICSLRRFSCSWSLSACSATLASLDLRRVSLPVISSTMLWCSDFKCPMDFSRSSLSLRMAVSALDLAWDTCFAI